MKGFKINLFDDMVSHMLLFSYFRKDVYNITIRIHFTLKWHECKMHICIVMTGDSLYSSLIHECQGCQHNTNS